MDNLKEHYNLIDVQKIIKILELYGKSKKIFCFGAGIAGEGLVKVLPPDYHIDCFLDNNTERHKQKLHNIPIYSPAILKTEKNYIVLVNSQHRKAISKQLESYGLKKGSDYFIIYDLFESWVRIEKFRITTNQFITFIKKIPDESFQGIKKIEDSPKIGIVCMCSIHRCVPWRDITLYLLLLLNGYHVSLIIDDLDNFFDFYIIKHHKFMKYYLDNVLTLLNNKFNNLDIIFYNKSKREKLGTEEENKINQLVTINKRYFDSLIYYKFHGKNNIDRTEAYQTLLEKNMSILLPFFKENSFDVIHLCGGVVTHQGIYTWIGEKLGFRVSTYDGSGTLGSIVSTDLPGVYYMDVVKTIKNNYFSEKQRQQIITLSKSHFNNRRKLINKPDGYSFQIVNSNKSHKYSSDFLIPLNISCDAAALGLDLAFSDTEEWLNETVAFILEHTDASIIIREHPGQCFIEEQTKDKDFSTFLKAFESSRCRYIKAKDLVNTYDILSDINIVLPYSSTIGIEAALMNKTVITHTSCYYSYSSFIKRAETKQQYFNYIIETLKGRKSLNKAQTQEAYLYYYYQMNSSITSNLTEQNNNWLSKTLLHLSKEHEVDKLLRIVAKNQPACYLNILDVLKGI